MASSEVHKADIKFHKALELPSPLNSTHDGVWFIFQPGRTFKAYIVSNGVAVPLSYDDAIDYSNLTSNVIPKKDPSENSLVDSNIQDTSVGSEVSGRLDSYATVEKRSQVSVNSSLFTINLNNPSGHYDVKLTRSTNISFSNMIGVNQSTVITLMVGGDYSLFFPSWLKPMPNNDDYNGSSQNAFNLITILIARGGSSPQGVYSLINVDLS